MRVGRVITEDPRTSPAPQGAAPSKDELFAAVAALPPEDKVALFKHLGMSRVGDNHTYDCPGGPTTGLVCNCVPPASMWTHPKDVEVHLKETWKDLLALAEARQADWKKRGII